MRKYIAFLPLLVSAAAFGQAGGSDDIVWLDNYQEALRVARETGKPIFLEYRCEP